MGAVLGLCFAVGALLCFEVWRTPATTVAPAATSANVMPWRKVETHAVRNGSGAALGFAFVAYLLTHLLVMAVIAGVLGAAVPELISRRRIRRDRMTRRSSWPDAVDGLVSAVRAGMSLPEAVCAIADRGPESLRPAFAAFAQDYRSTGRFEACIVRLRDELNDPVADRITEALLIARDVGGTDLGRMLRTLSEFLRQDLRLRGEVEARKSWTVYGARLAVAAPWFVLVLLSTRPGTVAAYSTPTGVVILVGSAAISAVAYYLMCRIGRLPEPRRITV